MLTAGREVMCEGPAAPAGLDSRLEEVEKLTHAIIDMMGQREIQKDNAIPPPEEPSAWDLLASIGRAERRLAVVRDNLGTILGVIREARNRLDN